MKHQMLNVSSDLQQLADAIDGALDLFDSDRFNANLPVPASIIQPSLFEQCIELCREGATHYAEPIRTIHHLSFTGGTLITKCLAAMPNVMVMNEVDPLSNIGNNDTNPAFTPTDMVSLLRQGDRKVSEDLLVQLFLNSLELLRKEFSSVGKRLLLRDHSHSHFLTGEKIVERPTLLSIVKSRFPTLSIVTVRNPIDSYLSLQSFGIKRQPLKPSTIDEYCRRQLAFLDAYQDVPIFKYEEFVEDPMLSMNAMCQALGLRYSEYFTETFDTFKFSGDSGRKGNIIQKRERRQFSDEFLRATERSGNYQILIDRLGYSGLSC